MLYLSPSTPNMEDFIYLSGPNMEDFISSVTKDSNSAYNSFLEFFKSHDLGTAYEIYCTCNDETMHLIREFLNAIPWRVAVEYYQTTELHWMNTWIKIGWWNDDHIEISPQLLEGKWHLSDNINVTHINGSDIRCVVWKGTGCDVILRIMANGFKTNIELERKGNNLIPINLAFDQPNKSNSIFSLATAELGSFESTSHRDSLDDLRILNKEMCCSNDNSLYFFQGYTMGIYFVDKNTLESNKSIYEDISDDE